VQPAADGLEGIHPASTRGRRRLSATYTGGAQPESSRRRQRRHRSNRPISDIHGPAARRDFAFQLADPATSISRGIQQHETYRGEQFQRGPSQAGGRTAGQGEGGEGPRLCATIPPRTGGWPSSRATGAHDRTRPKTRRPETRPINTKGLTRFTGDPDCIPRFQERGPPSHTQKPYHLGRTSSWR
jgi:hypothetical protein